MVRYISSFSVKTLHSMVNRGLLQMLCEATDGDMIVAASKSTVDDLRKATSPYQDRIKFRTLPINARNGRLALLIRYIQSAIQNLIQLAKSDVGDIVFYNFNNVFSISLLNFIARKIFTGRKIFITCHGEMEYLDKNQSDPRLYKRLMTLLTRKFFLGRSKKNLADGLYFIVLGDNIKAELNNYLSPELTERIFAIDHPVTYIPVHEKSDSKEPTRTGLKLGTVGIMNRIKGSDAYIELINNLADDKNIEFSIVGQIQTDIDKFKALGVKTGKNALEALDMNEFAEMVNDLDYILLLYPSTNYKLIASGALLDTLRFHKPLIAISTDYFRYFFNKFGEVGYLVNNLEEMSALIRNLKNKPIADFDYETIKSKLSPDALTDKLRTILRSTQAI